MAYSNGNPGPEWESLTNVHRAFSPSGSSAVLPDMYVEVVPGLEKSKWICYGTGKPEDGIPISLIDAGQYRPGFNAPFTPSAISKSPSIKCQQNWSAPRNADWKGFHVQKWQKRSANCSRKRMTKICLNDDIPRCL